jgi:hypothetical protein
MILGHPTVLRSAGMTMTVLEIKIEAQDFRNFISNLDDLLVKALQRATLDRGTPEYSDLKSFIDDLKTVAPTYKDDTTDHYILRRVLK